MPHRNEAHLRLGARLRCYTAFSLLLSVGFAGTAAASIGFAHAAASAPAETLSVAIGGSNASNCLDSPCSTIERAASRGGQDLRAGRASSVTIEVGPGTFAEHDLLFGPLTIKGAGIGVTVVSGQLSGTVFTVEPGALLTVSDLTVTQGQAPNGGGIDNAGALELDRVSVSVNSATATSSTTGLGGGIYNHGGSLTINDSTLFGNQASSGGGAIADPSFSSASPDQIKLSRDAVWSNTVVANAPGATGAPLGGGLLMSGGVVQDSTIADNTVLGSSGAGGGLFGFNFTLTHDTISGNQASQAGGIWEYPSSGATSATIFSANRPHNCFAPAPVPAFIPAAGRDDGYNLDDEPGGGCLFGSEASSPLQGVNPDLGSLQDNGGGTRTEAISGSSPVYDVIPASSGLCAGTDQRGVAWVQRGSGRCDAGAFQVDAPPLYVVNTSVSSVTAYAGGASGDAAPVLELSGAATGLSAPVGVVLDASGRLYVSNSAADSVTEYAPEVSGDVAPIATIAGARTGLSNPQGLTLDSAGDLWVSDQVGSVLEFAPGANGDAQPLAVISGSATQLRVHTGLSFGPAGILFVANSNGIGLTNHGDITEYRPGAKGNVAPSAVLGPSGSLADPSGLNFDGAGHLLVANTARRTVSEFAAGAIRTTAPVATISGPATGLGSPVGLDLDTAGDLFIANNATNTVTEYAPGAQGNAAPIATIAGPSTGLASPAFLAVLPPPPPPRVRAETRRRQSARQIARHGLYVTVRTNGPVRVSAKASVGGHVVARGHVGFRAAGRRRLHIHPTSGARRRLRHAAGRFLRITLTLRYPGGTRVTMLKVRLVRQR